MKLLTIVLVLFSFNASAGFLIEPYAGIGSFATTNGALSDAAELVEDDIEDGELSAESSTVFGGRIGYSFLLLSAGIDYEMDTFADGTRNTTSLFVGVDLPILLRFWAEYGLSSTYATTDEDLEDFDVTYDGGYSVGIGFTGLPFVSLNLEVENATYNFKDGDVEFDSEWASYLFSVSFPINL